MESSLSCNDATNAEIGRFMGGHSCTGMPNHPDIHPLFWRSSDEKMAVVIAPVHCVSMGRVDDIIECGHLAFSSGTRESRKIFIRSRSLGDRQCQNNEFLSWSKDRDR